MAGLGRPCRSTADCGVALCAVRECAPHTVPCNGVTASRAAAGWRDRRANQTSGPFPTMYDDVRWSYAQVGDACPDRHGQLRRRAVRVYWPRTQSHVVTMGRAAAGWRDRHADQHSGAFVVAI
eukprot:scaffold2748_cov154-Isochrysis_galbana.AAC.3